MLIGFEMFLIQGLPLSQGWTCMCVQYRTGMLLNASTMNINNGIKGPTRGNQNCNTSQILIIDGYDNARESLYTQVIV